MRTYADILRSLAKLLDEDFEASKEEVVKRLKNLIEDIEE